MVGATSDSLPSARITSELARRITTGELRDGDKVPSTRQITREFGVAMATATRVLTGLRQLGLVHAVAGVGTVVGARPGGKPGSAGAGTSAATASLRGDIATGPDTAREQPLTRERILSSGIIIADTEGISALSMRRVATTLATATMSLYRHVRNKDQLLALMVDRVFMDYPLPAAGPHWRASLEALCRLQWRAYHDHPWVAQYVSMTRPQLIPRAMAHTEQAMAVLKEIGLDVDDRLHAAVMLATYVRGTAVSLEPEAQAEQDTGMTNEEWMQSQNDIMDRIVASGQFPTFAEMSTSDEVELNLDTLFEFGLGRLMDGLEVFV
ncbi:MAG: TetR/AcrR family transcriptional regulator C-terminal domain-containing protein, partial [Nakamurella sp.]